MKEEESSEEEATAATPAEEQEAVPAELDGVCTPEPLDDSPKHEDQEGSSPEISVPYKWVVEAANLLIPAEGSSFSEALDLIESVMLVTALPSGHRAPPAGSPLMGSGILVFTHCPNSIYWAGAKCPACSQGLGHGAAMWSLCSGVS